MGILQGSKTKNASSSSTRKHRIEIASSDQRLNTTDGPGLGDAGTKTMEASDAPGAEGLQTLKRNQQASVDARKRKAIDIPMT